MYSGGLGTAAEPYLISNLQDFKDVENNKSAYFLQTCDIDLGENFQPIGWNNGNSDSGLALTGGYNGGGFALQNGTIVQSTKSEIGIFRRVSCKIMNLFLKNIKVSGYAKTGVLAGYVYGSAGYFENIHVNANCQVYGNSTDTGGIIGYFYHSNSTPILGLLKCSNAAQVFGMSNNTGGIVGQAGYIHIQNCYNTGEVIGDLVVGGICGYLYSYADSEAYKCSIGYCYNSANISGCNYVGGILGTVNNMGSYCYRCFVMPILITRVSGVGIYFGRVSGTELTRDDNNYASTNIQLLI